jgi:hypothetical protein
MTAKERMGELVRLLATNTTSPEAVAAGLACMTRTGFEPVLPP